MKAIVIGGDSFIGKRLREMLAARGDEVQWTSRRGDGLYFDMLQPISLPDCDVAYLCAAATKFIDCESSAEAYRVNVDAPIAIARKLNGKLVYLSSEAVERALHTNYGMHKALAENALLSMGGAVIARLGKTGPENLDMVCEQLITLGDVGKPGVHRLCT